MDALIRSISAPPRMAVVEGEPGIGKTRLVSDVVGWYDGTILVGHCHALREAFPLGPVIEGLNGVASHLRDLPLTPLAGALRPLLPEAQDALPASPPPLGDVRAEQHRLFRGVAEVLAALGPALLVLEDLHWADDGTCELLAFLSKRPPPDLSFIITYRGQDLPDTSPLRGLLGWLPSSFATRIELKPLGVDAVRELVGAILDTEEVSEPFARLLHEQTGGIPFAVEEVLHLLVERKDLMRRGRRWARRFVEELRVPPAVRDSIAERTSRLPPDALRVLRAASVLGVSSDDETLRGAAALSAARFALGVDAALRCGLLNRAGRDRYVLRHALAARAIYEAIAPPERRRYHARCLRVLEAQPEPPVGLLAHHSHMTGRRTRWVRYAERAAEEASSLGDDAAAARFLQDVLAEPGLPATVRVRLATRLGRAALHGLAHREAVDILRRVLSDEPLPPGERGELRFMLGLLLDQTGDASGAVREIARSATELRRRPALAAWAMVNLAVPSTLETSLREHMAWLGRATATALRQNDPAVRTAVLADRAGILMLVGDSECWRAVQELPQRPASAEEHRQLVRGRLNLGQAAFHVGHYEPARRFLEEGLEMSEALGYARQVGALETTALLLDWATGAWEGLEGRARALLEETSDVPPAAIDARLVLGLITLVRGTLPAATRLLEETLEEARRLGAGPVLAAAAAGVSTSRLQSGDLNGAVAAALDGLEVPSRKEIWAWTGEIGVATVEGLLASGRTDEAESVTRDIAAGLRGRDAPAAAAGVLTCRALVAESQGKLETAARLFSSAERRWAALPRPYRQALTLEHSARCAAQMGPRIGAERLIRALELLVSFGARRDAARLRATMRAHGMVFSHRGGRRGYGDELSPREREVAGLASEGLPNRQIAGLLFLSPKTVEHHVSSVLRKLRMGSRRDLIKAGTDSILAPEHEPARGR